MESLPRRSVAAPVVEPLQGRAGLGEVGWISSGAVNQNPEDHAERTGREQLAAQALGLGKVGSGSLQLVPPVKRHSARQPRRGHPILRTTAQPGCSFHRLGRLFVCGHNVASRSEGRGNFCLEVHI